MISLLGLTLRVLDHTTLNRRSATLVMPRLQPTTSDGGARPLHLLVDSTGLKLCGAGKRLVEKHGTKMRRVWRKLHAYSDEVSQRYASAGRLMLGRVDGIPDLHICRIPRRAAV